MGCVYVATNSLNGKEYVGWTDNLPKRKSIHKKSSENGSPLVFHCAIRKYGWWAFKWRVVFISDDQKVLKDTEVCTISAIGSLVPHGYNMTRGGDGFSGSHSVETRLKISNNTAARRPEVRKKISEALTGRSFSEQHRARLRASSRPVPKLTLEKSAAARRGKPLSEDHKQKIREKLTGDNNPAKTLEARRKLRQSRLGKHLSDETKRKIRDANLRRDVNSREFRKIEAILNGRDLLVDRD